MGLTKGSALDLAPYRIHVNAICPGFVESAFAEYGEATTKVIGSMHPFGQRMGEPDDIARIAVFLASDDARWVHGTGVVVDGAFTCQ
jgi:NAD(P)-dependent dehydrogenase (short-subunit alcohol dehydrogenase family)